MQCKNTKIFSLFEMNSRGKKFIFSHFRKVFAYISRNMDFYFWPRYKSQLEEKNFSKNKRKQYSWDSPYPYSGHISKFANMPRTRLKGIPNEIFDFKNLKVYFLTYSRQA